MKFDFLKEGKGTTLPITARWEANKKIGTRKQINADLKRSSYFSSLFLYRGSKRPLLWV